MENITLNIEECLSRVYTDGVTITGTGRPTSPLTAIAAGSGDMLRSTYDPTNVNADAFSMENMIEGATKKILTSAERTKLNNLSGTNTGDQDLTPYLTSATAAATYQPIGSYLTSISGLNISQLTNDSGYITSAALSPYLTTASAASTYQPILVSGTTIKTINGTSLLGAGDVTISGAPVLTSGSIPFSNGSTLIGDNSNLFWNNTNKRLGIGTNTPSSQVHIKGVSGVSNVLTVESPDVNPFIRIQTGTTAVNRRPCIAFSSPSTEWAVGFNTSDNRFRIAQGGDLGTDASCAMAIDKSTYNVGIGTANPSSSAKLDVWSTTSGFAPPEMTATNASAISTTSRKLIIYVTDTNGTFTSAGLWMWNGTTWKLILAQ